FLAITSSVFAGVRGCSTWPDALAAAYASTLPRGLPAGSGTGPGLFPKKEDLTICFAHVAYRMAERFAARNTGIRHFQVRSIEELTVKIADADVVSVSMMWRNNLISRAPKLKFIQSISAGTDQYSREALKAAGIRRASAPGVHALSGCAP